MFRVHLLNRSPRLKRLTYAFGCPDVLVVPLPYRLDVVPRDSVYRWPENVFVLLCYRLESICSRCKPLYPLNKVHEGITLSKEQSVMI